MSTLRDNIYSELLERYKKDKIKKFILKNKYDHKSIKDFDIEELKKLNEDILYLYNESYKFPEVLKGICDFINIQYSDSYDIQTLYKLMNEAKRFKKKSFHIKEIQNINWNIIKSYSFGIKLEKSNKYYLKVSDSTGLFKIHFSDETFMYYAKWISGAGKSKTVEGMFAAEKEVWINFLKILKKEKRKLSKPKNGIYRIFSQYPSNELIYKKIEKELPETPIVHESSLDLLNDMKFYFDNIPLFTRYGMPGVRKTLLVGSPGTGKTSVAIKIAKKNYMNKCIVFATNIQDVATHLSKCSEHKISTIIIFEDAESTLSNADSNLLNFLDGVDLPKNPLGSYIIMTTNFPDRIEDRIKKRPGRIDKIIEFGPLTGKYALTCAEIYFKDILFNESDKIKTIKEELYYIVNNMTGAQIKELAQSSMSYAVSNKKEVSLELIEEVKEKMKDALTNLSKYAEDNSDMSKIKKIGLKSTVQTQMNHKDFELEENYIL